jgi:hypothetical protein
MNMGNGVHRPPEIPNIDSVEGYFQRFGTACVEYQDRVVGNTESLSLEFIRFRGTVRILEHWAIITDAPALTNATLVYIDLWDGTTAIPLTDDNCTLSGAPVGTMFFKDRAAGDPFTVLSADQGRVYERINTQDRVGKIFLVNGKNGVDNYVRFHITTNAALDFSLKIHIEYQLLNGAQFEVLV